MPKGYGMKSNLFLIFSSTFSFLSCLHQEYSFPHLISRVVDDNNSVSKKLATIMSLHFFSNKEI